MFATHNNHSFIRIFTLALGLLLVAGAATAAEQSLPITITSDNAELSRVSNVSTYTGNVVLERGGLTLHGDKLVITRVEPSQYKGVLTGNPATLKRVPQAKDEELITGHGDKIVYLTSTSQVTLRGDAVIDRSGDVIHSDVIRHDLDTQITKAGGSSSDGDRVQITLQPENSGNGQ